MGRPEKPVNSAGGIVAQFARELRELRAKAGNPTYREMARSAMFSSSVLSSAASGNRMPSLPVTLAFVAACGGDREHWRQRWLDTTGGVFRSTARSGQMGRAARGQTCPAQLPQRPRTFIGRAIELAWLRYPSDTPIVLSGPIGTGKTDLALHYAYERVADMPDGQLYADLGAQHAEDAPGPYDVIDGFLRALGIPSDQLRGTPSHRAGLYRTVLAERRLLVLLDNVRNEQQVRPLLVETATSTTLLVSRRRLLGLRHVRRLPIGPLPRADSIALIAAAIPATVRADPADFDRLADLCGDLPQALDIALRRIALRPHVVLQDLLNGWQQGGIALSWLSIGDLSMRESLLSTCRTLSREARTLLHWYAQTAGDDGSLPAPEDEVIDELIDAGLLTHAHHGFGGLVISPLVRAFARDTGGGDAWDRPVRAAIPHAG
jgi:hypothetical protein